MKKLLYTLTGLCMLVTLSSCEKWFLDLDPLDQRTDVVYFKKPSHFNEYSIGFSTQLIGWKSNYGHIYTHFDGSSDVSTYFSYSGEVGRGMIQIPTDDERWSNCYNNIRTINILLEKGDEYPGNLNEIKQYLSEAYFYRAYNYFHLLKFFGGVPIVTKVLDIDSPELMGPRASRYEVIDLILSDLDRSFEGLLVETAIPATEKGRISLYGAKAFKARVLLYEATWRRYNGTSTDYEGSAGPSSDQVSDFLDQAVKLCDEVMTQGKYTIWNHNGNALMSNASSRYLFCLEEADSNPVGLTKSSNNEFIIYSVYDKGLRPGGINLNQTIPYMDVSRKFIDMFVCTDGLPIDKSNRFQGYASPENEFKNRDNRLKSYVYENSADKSLTNGRSGYSTRKFEAPTRSNLEESANYPVLRLAEVFLTYAEAVYERDGAITDADLGRTINILRNRGGVAGLTNKLVNDNGLNMLDEIRRERAVELYMEGYRFDDLKRWGIAERELNASHCGIVVGSAAYPTSFVDSNGDATEKFAANTYVWGTEKVSTPVGEVDCVVIESKSNISFAKTHYLWPIPQRQRNLNSALKQNKGY